MTEIADITERTKNLSEYDILIDSNCMLTINNCFRYWVQEDLASKSYPLGIKIQKESLTEAVHSDKTKELLHSIEPLEDFNQYSYKLSPHCKIKANFTVETDITIVNPTASITFAIMTNDGIKWCETAGDYKYSYQEIWGRVNGREIAVSDPVAINDDALSVTTAGVLFTLGKDSDSCEGLIRLYRTKTEDDNESTCYVDVPLCGTQYIYDNGISVCGYKWSSQLPSDEVVTIDSDVTTLGFKANVAYTISSDVLKILK